MKLRVEIVRRRISAARVMQSLELASECGAVATFTGVVRGTERGAPIEALEYTCYESMARTQIEKIARAAGKRWPVQAITLFHRTGKIRVGEAAIFIAVQSAHRKEAFAACQYLIDRLKKTGPIWKGLPEGDVFIDALGFLQSRLSRNNSRGGNPRKWSIGLILLSRDAPGIGCARVFGRPRSQEQIRPISYPMAPWTPIQCPPGLHQMERRVDRSNTPLSTPMPPPPEIHRRPSCDGLLRGPGS